MINRLPQLRLTTRRLLAVAAPPSRRYATEQDKVNVTRAFYKSFTRPIAKVLLGAVFTYQLAYWTWVKLETDEIRTETDATITDLEAKVEEYTKKVAAGHKAKET